MAFLYSLTILTSAALLFMVQPMIGRLVLPLVGGSPVAWNTCMVFFQSLLLAGYAYAHWLTQKVQPKKQVAVHISVFCVALVAMAMCFSFGPQHTPIGVFPNLAPQGSSYPMFGMLALLAVAIGIPFFVVSTSAPLIQKWFSVTGHRNAGNPYFLYAASNVGSLISLLGYPFIIEPRLSLQSQQWIWAGGFLLLLVLAAMCGKYAQYPMPIVNGEKNKNEDIDSSNSAPTKRQIFKWVLQAFVPSSLMLGVTTYMTTDITSMPLLWVPPLALYLITFIIAFGKMPNFLRMIIGNIAPVGLLLLVFIMCAPYEIGVRDDKKQFIWLSLHIVIFFLVSLMCHTELACNKPKTKYLTHFFLWMSFGGVLGGIFNALIAPLIFRNTWEYQVALGLAAFLVPTFLSDEKNSSEKGIVNNIDAKQNSAFRSMFLDLFIPLMMLLLVALMSKYLYDYESNIGKKIQDLLRTSTNWLNQFLEGMGFKSTINSYITAAFLTYALPCMLAFFCIDRPIRFGLCVASILLVGVVRNEGSSNETTKTIRSPFGMLKSYENTENSTNRSFSFKKPDLSETATQYTNELTGNDPWKYCVENKKISENQLHLVRFADVSKNDEIVYSEFSTEKDKISEKWEELKKAKATDKLKIVLIPYMTHIHLEEEQYSQLVHGTTLHGKQARKNWRYTVVDEIPFMGHFSPWNGMLAAATQKGFDIRQEPMTYYHRSGPVGSAFEETYRRFKQPHIGMVGLGSGSVAAYALPDMPFTFYEIDSAVLEMVDRKADRDKESFTYLADARKRGAKIEIILGDGRLKLSEQPERKYSMLLVDAFSSDSIPQHLLTREAVKLYIDRIEENGLLMLHISNKFVDLEPVCAAIASDLGLVSRVMSDNAENHPGKTASHWVVMVRAEKDLGEMPKLADSDGDIRWKPLQKSDVVPSWTDDYADMLRVMRIEEIRNIRKWFKLPVSEKK